MTTIIYYFTGTGNSLAAARRICEVLEDCTLKPFAGLAEEPKRTVPAADRVGIVCPVYDAGLPAIVADAASRLDLREADYVFAVLTMGAFGASALHQLDGILKEAGRGLDAGWAVPMVGNFVPLYSPLEGEKKRKRLEKADARLTGIAKAILGKEPHSLPFAPFTTLLRHILYPGFIENIHTADENFRATDACTSCGICEEVCPVGNIKIHEGRPQWLHRCELCMACLHFCPVAAIQWGEKTGKRGRYHHPEVTVEDMKRQLGG